MLKSVYFLNTGLAHGAMLFPTWHSCYVKFRSIHTDVFCKIYVLKNFTKFTGKHLYWNLFLIMLIIKKWLQQRCFIVNFVKCLRTAFLKIKQHLRWLLLEIVSFKDTGFIVATVRFSLIWLISLILFQHLFYWMHFLKDGSVFNPLLTINWGWTSGY